jgi:hypothetical protein
LKLKYDEALSNFAFNFNLRRYTMVMAMWGMVRAMVNGVVPVIDNARHVIQHGCSHWIMLATSFTTVTRIG